MSVRGRLWDRMYRVRPSWDLGRADPGLVAQLDARGVRGPGRAIDLGCGTGDNAVELARRGFAVTAIDVADRALTAAAALATSAGVTLEVRRADVTRLDELDGGFDLAVDRGLVMSLFGHRSRRAYAATLARLVAPGGQVYEHQWRLPTQPRPVTRPWLLTTLGGVILAPDELVRLVGASFDVEVVDDRNAPVDDRGIRRLGVHTVAQTSYWLTRRR